MAAVLVLAPADDELSPFETAFIRTVLEHRGLFHQPTEDEFRAALDVLRRFDQQCGGNPQRFAWEPDLGQHAIGELRAQAFVMFGTTAPTPAQWHKARVALFGPCFARPVASSPVDAAASSNIRERIRRAISSR